MDAEDPRVIEALRPLPCWACRRAIMSGDPQLLEHGGKQFAAYVNEITGVPSWIIDPDSLDFTLGASLYLSSEASVRTAADAFVEAHKNVFGLDPKQLGAPRITGDSQWWFVSYPQLHGGYRVLGAEIGLTVTRGGALIAAGATGFPKLEVDASPSLGSSAAIAAARGNTIAPNLQADVKDELVIVPEEVGDTYAFHLAWEVILYNYENDPPFSKTFIVDAHTGKILHEYSNILTHGGSLYESAQGLEMEVSQSGTGGNRESTGDFLRQVSAGPVPLALALPDTSFDVLAEADGQPQASLASCTAASGTGHSISGLITLNYYASPNATNIPIVRHVGQPFPYAKFRVRGEGFSCMGYAGADGAYSVSLSEAGTYEVTFEIANDTVPNEGKYLLKGLSTCEQSKSFTIAVDGASRLDYDWGWGDSGDGGLTSFALNGVYQIRKMYEYFHPELVSSLDMGMRRLKVQLSRRGNSHITLGGTYAMSSDIALHEYTHGVLYYATGIELETISTPSMDNADAMQEGFADFFAADATDHEQYGGPLTGTNDPVKSVRVYGATTRFMYNWCTKDQYNQLEGSCGLVEDGPDDDSEPDVSPHLRGKIINGAIWRIRQNLGGEAIRLLFTALKMEPTIATFEDLRARYEAADEGANAALIEDRFMDRKIGGPLMPLGPSITVTSNRNPRITWTDRSSLEDGYVVESQRVGDEQWSVIAMLNSDITEHVDTGITCRGGGQGFHRYRVAAFKAYDSNTMNEKYRYTITDTLWTYSVESYLSLGQCIQFFDLRTEKPTDGDGFSAAQPDSTDVNGNMLEAYPNPFNPTAAVRYSVRDEAHVRLRVYDVLGRLVVTLVDEVRPVGQYTVQLDGGHLPSGTYIIRFKLGRQQLSRVLQLIK